MQKKIVILHGWNGKAEKWSTIKKLFEHDRFEVFIPQLPGFITDTDKPWNLDDYSRWVLEYLKTNNIHSATFLCHSNGGRIGAKLAVRYPHVVEKLILVACAGVRTASYWKVTPLRLIAKLGRLIGETIPGSERVTAVFRRLLYSLIREHDYQKASLMLRQTMSNIINEDLASTFNKIAQPTVLLWGTKDTLTPKKAALVIKRHIRNSRIIWIEDAGHALPFTHSSQLVKHAVDFINN